MNSRKIIDHERELMSDGGTEKSDEDMEESPETSETDDPEEESNTPDGMRTTHVQTVINSLDSAKESANRGKKTEKRELGGPGGEEVQGGLLQEAADRGKAIKETQRSHDDNLQSVNTNADTLKRKLESRAHEEASSAKESENVREKLNHRIHGGESGDEIRFGMTESMVNVQFLARSINSDRKAEATSTTFGEEMSAATGENVSVRAEQLNRWTEEFHADRNKAEEITENLEEDLGLDDRLEDYNKAVSDYEDVRKIDDPLKNLDGIEANSLDEIASSVGDGYDQPDDELVKRAARFAADAHKQMNDEDNPKERFEPQNEEFDSAVDSVKYAQAAAIDRVAANKNRLDEAVEEVESVRDEIQGLRSDLETYESEVEDLTNIEGVGSAHSEKLEDFGAETIMDVALMGEANVAGYPEFQRQDRKDSRSVPDMDDIKDKAFDALTDIDAEMDYLSVEVTRTIEETDLSPERETRRAAQALYDSVDSLKSTLATMESNLPDIDEYKPDWDGREDTLEAERQNVYEEPGDSDVPEPESALGI